MYNLIFYFLSLLNLICGAKYNGNSIIVPCKINDEECMIKSANMAIGLLGPGVPSLGIKPIDPIKMDLLEEKLPSIQLTFKDSDVYGFSKCKLQNVKLDMDSLKLNFVAKCPSLEMSGQYVVSGTLLSLPLEGHGSYNTSTGALLININADLERITGDDGKTYLAIKKTKPVAELLERVKFQYENLFNGNKELSDAVHAFAHDNYKEVMALLQTPVLDSNVKYMTTCINQLLKTTPIDNLFIK